MRAVRLHAPGEALRVEDIPRPDPQGTEVRVAVAGAGVCRTDLHIADGIQRRIRLPLTLGHEVAGHVDSTGPGAVRLLGRMRIAIGDPVLVFGGWGCGACPTCLGGGPPIRVATDAGSSCTGSLAQVTFRWGICACNDVVISSGDFFSSGFDSSQPPVSMGGALCRPCQRRTERQRSNHGVSDPGALEALIHRIRGQMTVLRSVTMIALSAVKEGGPLRAEADPVVEARPARNGRRGKG